MDIIGNARSLASLGKQLLELPSLKKDADAQAAIAKMQVELAELNIKIAELLHENLGLKEELKKAATQEIEVILKNGLYYKKQDDSGPFCTHCYDSQKKFIRVQELPLTFARIGRWTCNSCKAKYGGPGI